MPDVREEFEAWQVETGRTDPIWFGAASFDDRKREYVLKEINRDWIVWQASRAALKVELPEQLPPAIEVAGKMVHTAKDAKWNACLDRVTEALQQAGIEVK